MKRVAIIGTGTMGPGMAATLARGGLDVGCFDTLPAARDKTPGEVETALAVLDRIGGPEGAERGTVTVHGDLAEAVAGCDLVIEAVPENADIKAKVFADLDRLAPAQAVLASNTSGIPITRLAESGMLAVESVRSTWMRVVASRAPGSGVSRPAAAAAPGTGFP